MRWWRRCCRIETVTLSAHSLLNGNAMSGIVKIIASFNAGRDPERFAMKYKAMRSSPFVFLRGTCHLFNERLPRAKVLDDAPPVWICGDMHLENFCSYKADNRLIYFDNNDFDE